MIVVDRVNKAFSAPVLRSVSLSVPDGCLYGLIGPGASGKSVLLKLIVGLIRTDAGRVVVDDEDLTALDEIGMQRARGRFGFLFQNYALFDYLDVGENIAFPLRRLGGASEEEIQTRVRERLAAVSLAGFERRAVSGLSGGQKKRVGVARATITRAPYLLYDEPAAGLDPVTSQKIFELLAREQREAKSTVIMVSSDIDRLLTVTDRVGMMYRGELIFDGTTDEAKSSTHPVVKQFVHGEVEGPL